MRRMLFACVVACLSSVARADDIPCPVPPARPYIEFHGGRVLIPTRGQPYQVHAIFYGKLPAITQVRLEQFIRQLGGTPYFNTVSVFTDNNGNHVPNAVALAATRADSYQHGKSFSEDDVADYVSAAVTSGWLPHDANAVYAIFFAPDVTVTYKGSPVPGRGGAAYHYWTGKRGLGHLGNPSDLHFAVMKYPYPSLPAKVSGAVVGDNGAWGIMAQNFVHELVESITDPEQDGWKTNGIEIGDACDQCPLVPFTLGSQTIQLERIATFDGGNPHLGFCGRSFPCASANPCAGKTCGDLGDACGRPQHCGDCKPGQQCGYSLANECGCPPPSCEGRTCGSIANACGQSLRCGGACPAGLDCIEGTCKHLSTTPKCPCGGAPPLCKQC